MHDIILNEKVMKRNDDLATENRRQLRERGIFSINLISSPGSGKTTLIEKTIGMLDGGKRLAVIEGDITTDVDAQRIMKKGIPVRQINTGRSCHLDAHMISHTLPWVFEQGDTADVVSADPIRAVYGVKLIENARIGFEPGTDAGTGTDTGTGTE